MRTLRYWQDQEKQWHMEKYEQEIERQDMKKIRRLWWHLSDEMGLVLWTVAILLGSSILWLLFDLTLSSLR